MTDQDLDALMEKLLLGKHGWWTLQAVKAICHMRDLYGRLSEEANRSSGTKEAYAIWSHYTLMSGTVARDLQRMHPEEDALTLDRAILGPADFEPDRRAAIYGEMFAQAERVHQTHEKPRRPEPTGRKV